MIPVGWAKLKNWPAVCIQPVSAWAAALASEGRKMRSQAKEAGQDKASRIELIGRVQMAYEHLKDTMQRYHDDSPRARAAIAAARRRLSLLNRALAMLALEVAQQPA
jgi:hypothetical protein